MFTIFIQLVVRLITCLDYKILNMFWHNYIHCIGIKMTDVTIKEEDIIVERVQINISTSL